MTGLEEEVRSTSRRVYDIVDPIPIQRALQHKWHDVRPTQRLVQAKFSLDSYVKHLKVLQSAFKTIESATGISALTEIVSMVIKSEEQSYNQHRQVNLLNAEAETLEEELMSAQRTISHMMESQARGEKQATTLIRTLKENLADVREAGRAKGGAFNRVRDALDDTFAAVKVTSTQTLVELFSSSEFQSVKRNEFTLTSRIGPLNVLSHLAEAEANITALQSWQSYVQSSQPVISATTLRNMTYKRFDMSPISIKSTLADTLMEEDDSDELRTPLREDQIRSRMKTLFDQRTEPHSGAKSVTDHRKSFRMPL